MVSVMKVEKAPLESYADIGGLDAQIQEIKVAVELPLTHPELYEDIGIKPPKGVILYGEPGTCKTLLAKAVANSTLATFLRVVGSELIQKYLGDGPKLVRELFRVADNLSPSIVFIDEIDVVGTKRYDAHSGGEREIQRTMLELLNQLDRKIEFPLPAIKTRRRIFYVHCHRFTVMSYIYSLNLAYKNHKMPILAVKILKILIALAINPCLLTKTDLKECFDC
ncbi:putative proteasome endopeptidase complex [Helianthus annuus]|uniref:Proteasome endopeptidase complex n=2 Tax=Helianthus annuus TaxID=4232 RepID=A0A9K3JND4_HELAN|nr:putative proteasome endopeptidase complex [Helianthus annuus]KAJ0604667.1 putative proteasome endopeptidase complex [Helianthus annuus]KAJ0939816.1 putative proteasome endopeptidase complex [Helianthus annuus]